MSDCTEYHFSIIIERVKELADKKKINLWEAFLLEAKFTQVLSGSKINFRKQNFDTHRLKFGYRWYFRCIDCGSLVRILYLSNGELSCRKCHNLKYKSSSRHRNTGYENLGKHIRKALKLEEKLSKRLRIENKEKLAVELEELAKIIKIGVNAFFAASGERVEKIRQKADTLNKE